MISVTAHIDGHPQPLEGTLRIEREPDDLDYSGDVVMHGLKDAVLDVPGIVGTAGSRLTYRVVGVDGGERTGWGYAIHGKREADDPHDLKVRYEAYTRISGGLDGGTR